MTEEKIKQGEELLKKISRLQAQKSKWELSQKIRRLELCTIDGYDRVDKVLEVDGCFVNFEDLKLLVLAKIERRLKEVQTEFDNL